MGILSKIFASQNTKQIDKLKKIADKVMAYEEEYAALDDNSLKAKTEDFKARYNEGESLDSLLPEAFGAVREASRRTLGMMHYYEQVIGGVALHQGRIAEMMTGEGKTLVATLPVYLNALTGKGVHVVTVNSYLAARDAEWMGKIYKFLGLTVGISVNGMSHAEKQKAYLADITYATNSELGFDYLRDNMVISKEQRIQRPLEFALIDEVDSILIDEARTPLIISGRKNNSNDDDERKIYIAARDFVKTLDESDYAMENKDKTVRLEESGARKAEEFFKIENLGDIENQDTFFQINNALKARFAMRRDKDYIVNNGQVIIVDEFTGRTLEGRRYSNGLHQALEAKEGVEIQVENKTLATITYQNFFRLYNKLAGMTGTAKSEEDEFKDIYGIEVLTIPTHKPIERFDEADEIYLSEENKVNAILEDIAVCYALEQPVLIGTVNVDSSEMYSSLLERIDVKDALKRNKFIQYFLETDEKDWGVRDGYEERLAAVTRMILKDDKRINVRGIKHEVLNAKNHEREADIIAQAGRKGSVTIATNMAGRGTDIMLGGNPEHLANQRLLEKGYAKEDIAVANSHVQTDDENILKIRGEYNELYAEYKKDTDANKEEVIKLGGLRIIGTERHEARRIDNQLRGRSGRQGDPGSSVFYIALEDEMFKNFGEKGMIDKFRIFAEEDTGYLVKSQMVSKVIEATQKKVEGRNFLSRKTVLKYDGIVNAQRREIYAERNRIIDGVNVHDKVVNMMKELADKLVNDLVDYTVDCSKWDYDVFNETIASKLLSENTGIVTYELATKRKIHDAVRDEVIRQYEEKVERLKAVGIDFDRVERGVLLDTMDNLWIDHMDSMDALEKGIGLRAFANKDPLIEFQREGTDMYNDMVSHIRSSVATILAKCNISEEVTFTQRAEETSTNERSAAEGESKGKRRVNVKRQPEKAEKVETYVRSQPKIGPNDPCPCGSGKKYKKCCGQQ